MNKLIDDFKDFRKENPIKTNDEIKAMGKKSIAIQLCEDYKRLFEENEFMTPRNARRQLVETWNLPHDFIKQVTDKA